MFASFSPRWRAIVNSIAYSALVALVIGLGYFTFRAINEHHLESEASGHDGEGTEPASPPLVELDGFATRRERSSDGERLQVSLKLRLNASTTLNCYVFVLARNDHASPKLWAAWPIQGPNSAITGGGHFNGSNPTAGHAIALASGWTRLNATLDQPTGKPPFDTVMVYVVNPKGEILLARPFAL